MAVSPSHATGDLVGLARYTKMGRLGEGTYGIVYKGQDKITGEIVAMKKIRLASEDEGVPSNTLREVSFLKELAHPNVVQYVQRLIPGNRLG